MLAAAPMGDAVYDKGDLMLRLLSIGFGLLFVSIGAVWFASPLLDPQLNAIAGPLVKAGTPKLALDNMLSVALAALSLVGVLLLAWGAIASRSKATVSAT